MYTAFLIFALMCWTAHADHHHHLCRSSNMTGFLSVMGNMAEIKAAGQFTYDSQNKRLRFQTNTSIPWNVTTDQDLLVFFDEGIIYKIDSKNQSCEKKLLQSTKHPFDLPADATYMSTMISGSVALEGEGMKFQIWSTPTPNLKGNAMMCLTMRCLPVSTIYVTESSMFMFSNMNVELDVKDPDLLTVPSFCQGLPAEEAPEGTAYSFFDEII
ncbi:ependymin [Corythoichthys intestinalis]|uniref:ependymin n=1 Tax=Corythoichthys intestinalis TaxID=161448 RepID=UPI0025A6539C|nr:ependymin [Corythoichthys intestinalis]XP_061801778.1 ependymin-1-like [Nerophis lumbriciformis]